MSASNRLLEYFKKHVGKDIDRHDLNNIAKVIDWTRVIRQLRQDGWDIESTSKGYVLHSLTQIESGKKRETISKKLRYAVLQRDNSTCQRCGKSAPEVKLEVDHKIPVEWRGTTDISNLWALCTECNSGKKHFFSDFEVDIMKEIMSIETGYQKLIRFFQLKPNQIIEPIQLQVISNIRDWTRTIRLIRQKEKMKIEWVKESKEFPQGGYINKTN